MCTGILENTAALGEESPTYAVLYTIFSEPQHTTVQYTTSSVKVAQYKIMCAGLHSPNLYIGFFSFVNYSVL